MSFVETIWSALISTGLLAGLAVVLGILLKDTFRGWLLARIRSGIQFDFDSELETHKAKLALQTEEGKLRLSNDLEVHRAFIDTVRLSFSEGQRSSMERKLIAVEKIWDEVLQLRKLTLSKMALVDALKENETQRFRELMKSDLGSSFLQKNSAEENKERLQKLSSDLERVQPFVGQYLWSLLECYRTIHMRVFIVLEMFGDDASKALGWSTDEGTYGIVAAALDERELEYFNQMQFGKFTWLIGKLESKMLAELRHIVSGQHFAQDALGKIDERAIERMRQAVASAQDKAR